MPWTFDDVAAHYRRQGNQPPREFADEKAIREHKYKAQKKMVDGKSFDSTVEAQAYQILTLWQKAGVISDLRLQPRFTLQDAFQDTNGTWRRVVRYIGDFKFFRDGKEVVVEIKGFETPVWKLKSKLFRAKFPEIDLQVWNRQRVKELSRR